MNRSIILTIAAIVPLFVACDDDDSKVSTSSTVPSEWNDIQIDAAEYYSGGKLGTTFQAGSYSYQQPTPAVENAGMSQSFQLGEYFFERDFTENAKAGESAFAGLGPLYVRAGCLYCHPSYGHGKRQTEYQAAQVGNGYLLVLYDKQTDGYLTSLTGMPQTVAVAPFKAPLDEDQIKIDWLSYTDEWGNKFDDGETYELIYPEVTIPASAYYVPIQSARGDIDVSEVGVRLENTIGIYGTGLLDAIPADSILAQWKSESAHVTLNPAMWDQTANEPTGLAAYKCADATGEFAGKTYVKRFTYAMTRPYIEDGPGANAIWNITNVTRSDRRYHYMTKAYAETASNDADVQAKFADYFPEEAAKYDNIKDAIYYYLMGTDPDGNKVAEVEMTDDDYKAFMVWHRGLAVPAARDLDDPVVKKGHELFREIGCARCHRPSWTTGSDEIIDPNGMITNSDMPRYPNQTIWPYTDMVQHRLFMQNDIRTGWCRTTPLWGRGLSLINTGAEDRLHDCRARSTMEAIMWHGNSESDARKAVENFRALSKEERDAVIAFVDAI